MSNECSLHRLPRAGVDPIDAPTALSMLTQIAHRPRRYETIVLMLDYERRGLGVMVVSGTVALDAMFDVLDVIISLDSDELGAIVVGSVRPSHGVLDGPDPDRRVIDGHDIDKQQGGAVDLDAHDLDRWLEATAMVDDRGLDLLEWFVIGHTVTCPRDVFGEPPRW
jgi:hypothetical protein